MKNNAKLGNGHNQNLNSVFESTVTEFIKLWKNGQEAALNANCKNGRAWLNLSTYLGYYGHDENESLFPEDVPKRFKTNSSPSKLRRDRKPLQKVSAILKQINQKLAAILELWTPTQTYFRSVRIVKMFAMI